VVSTPLKNMSSSVGMIIPLPKKWKAIQNNMVPVTTNQFFPVGQVAKMRGFDGFVM
jgi:hypothetical protein